MPLRNQPAYGDGAAYFRHNDARIRLPKFEIQWSWSGSSAATVPVTRARQRFCAKVGCKPGQRPARQPDPLHLVLRQPILRATVKLSRARALVSGHRLRVLDRAVIAEIDGDAGRTERVVAGRRRDAGARGTAASWRQASF
jgi:hypothetical protein